ncbi:hypothetical protein CCR85_06405 [Rhodothalassium salexigens]|nr:hypothetical protein [Rhodothalassium salexigens]
MPHPAHVVAVRREAANVVTLTLAPDRPHDARAHPTRAAVAPGLRAKGQMAPDQFAPGQFAMLYAFGVGEAAISYSGNPASDAPIDHTVRAAGATTTALANLRVGDALAMRGPYGRGWPMAAIAGRDLIIMAGGLGLAPLRPVMMAALLRSAGARRVALLYGTRSPRTLLFASDRHAWAPRGAQLLVTVDRAGPDWTGHVGLVHRLIPRARIDPANAVAFLCGPEVMMRFSAAALVDAGVAPARVWLSLERNMKCAIGHCGHCQFGADFVCWDGPVLRYDRIAARLRVPEL